MTDSPNLALAEEIEALCAPHYACGVPPISSQNSTINSGWLQTGQHLPTCPIAIAAKIRALRAQPSGDWVMDAGKAKAVLGESLRADGSIDNLVHYMSWAPGDEKICLDDRFTVEELQAIVFCVLSAAKEKKAP